MWRSIAQQLSEAIGSPVHIEDKKPVTGGDIHQSYFVETDTDAFFIKINERSKYELFDAEVEGLKHLSASGAIRMPEVTLHGIAGDSAFLAMQYLEFTMGSDNDWAVLAKSLAELHSIDEQKMYGWERENFIGTNIQPNQWSKNWSVFFSEERIGWQLALAKENGYDFGDTGALVAAVHDILLHHQPMPSYLHGDLWQGNVGFDDRGPVLFDPAFYIGDSETDIAMTELFGGFPQAFYDTYQNYRPLDKGYHYRKVVYNLYHQLNHCNLFGGHYEDTCRKVIRDLSN